MVFHLLVQRIGYAGIIAAICIAAVTQTWASGQAEQSTQIVAVIHCDYPPVSSWDKKTNIPSGFFVDVMDDIAKRTGIRVSYICKSTWPEMITAIEKGEADLGVLLKSGEREKRLAFSEPIDITYLSYFARSQTGIDAARLPGSYVVGAIKGSMSHEHLRNQPESRLHLYSSYREGIFALLAGEIDVFAGEESMILKNARETDLETRIRKVGKPFVERERGIAVRKDDIHLLGLLNQGLKGFAGSPAYQRIYLKWYGKPSPYWTIQKILLLGACLLFVIVVGMASWRYRSISRINKMLMQSIEERRRAEIRLQENEKRLNDILDNVGAYIFMKETQYRYTYANRKGCDFCGVSAEEIIGKGDDAFFSASSVEEIMRSDRPVFEKGETVMREETDLRLADNQSHTFWTVKLPLRDLSGNIYGLCGISTDITELKKAEETRRQGEEFVKNILDTVDEGFLVIDRDYRILTANKAYCGQVGLRPDEVVGRHCYRVSHKIDRPCFEEGHECAVKAAFATGEPHKVVHKHGDEDGHVLFVETKAFPMKDGSGRVISAIETITNITEKQLLEEERLKAQKLESIGTLAGGIAHDFNNLLQGIFGYISMAKLTFDQRDRSLSMLEQAEKALHQSVNLTTQLLTFSKGGKPVKKRISLVPTIENASKFALSGSRSSYFLEIEPGLWQTDADEGQLSQVIQNIVLNADQAMPGGGTVTVSAWNCPSGDDSLPPGLAGDNCVVLSISDTGIGIPQDDISRIFDPYFTTKQRGSGLGLATAYSIIKNHGGAIQVKSELSKGSTFAVYLPAVKDAEPERDTAPREAAAARKGRILFMDDEEMMRNVAVEMIAALGHEVESVADGKSAVEMFSRARESGRPFDIVILDLTVKGGMGGEETFRHLCEADPAVRAVVSSGYADNAVVARYRDNGFSAFLNKPYKIEELKDCLNLLLA